MSSQPQYPPLLHPGAFLHPLGALPLTVRQDVTHELRQGGGSITRAFLSALNFNMLGIAPDAEQAAVAAELRSLSAQDLRRLAQYFTCALREWQALGCEYSGSSSREPTAACSEIHSDYDALSSEAAVHHALERDENICVLSLDAAPEVTHIVPYAFGRSPGHLETTMPNIYRFLTLFAGETVANRICNYLMLSDGAGGCPRINQLENLICLNLGNHDMFGKGLFVLEPVGDPLMTLRNDTDTLYSYNVRFSWLPGCRSQGEAQMREHGWDLTQVVDAGSIMSEEEDETLCDHGVARWMFRETLQPPRPRLLGVMPVQTGYIFSLTTANPFTHPLPHPHLLQLSASIMRVCRAAGIAGEDNGWDSNLDEEMEAAAGGDYEVD